MLRGGAEVTEDACCSHSKAPWRCRLRAMAMSHGGLMAGRGGTCVRLVVSDSTLLSTTSSMGGSWTGPSALAAFQSGSSQKENWRASSSPFSPSGNTTESPCCSSFHTCSWWSWPQAFMLCVPSIIAPMCPLSDSGACNVVSLMQMNAYSQSRPSSTSSINFSGCLHQSR